MIDWGEGDYEHTAAILVEAAEAGVDALTITPGERVLDLGCGTGNAALAAARRGARVMAVDPAARLVGVTEAWFEEQESHHPVWHFVRRALGERPERWDAVRAQSLEALRAGNQATDTLRVTSDYLIVAAVVA